MAVRVFKFTDEQLAKLKEVAVEGKTDDVIFSSHETLSEHIWRCATEARKLEESQETKLFVAEDQAEACTTQGLLRQRHRHLHAGRDCLRVGGESVHLCRPQGEDDSSLRNTDVDDNRLHHSRGGIDVPEFFCRFTTHRQGS
jgi:hypothetical protein